MAVCSGEMVLGVSLIISLPYYILENNASNAFFAIFLTNILKIIANSPASGWLRQWPPLRGRPHKMFSRTEILAAPLLFSKFSNRVQISHVIVLFEAENSEFMFNHVKHSYSNYIESINVAK